MDKVGPYGAQVWLFAPVANAVLRLGEWNRRRQIRTSCGPLSETLLRDIGFTRADVDAALGAPLNQDASEAIVREVLTRATNW
jgi:uncharacterized protein YjiS (DUF1127 family)